MSLCVAVFAVHFPLGYPNQDLVQASASAESNSEEDDDDSDENISTLGPGKDTIHGH